MRECIGKCCDDASCDLAFMFGDHCYSVQCQSEKLCQAVLAKPSHLEPKVSYVARGFIDDDSDKGRFTVQIGFVCAAFVSAFCHLNFPVLFKEKTKHSAEHL